MVALSQLDLDRFGIVTARDSSVSAETLATTLSFCRENRVEMLIARCSTDDLAAAQRLEDAGGRLMDTLVYYSRVLVKGPLPESSGSAGVRPIRGDDADAVRRIASQCFEGYLGHYHADPRLDRRKCDEAYQSWAHRSCISRDVADEVLVAEVEGELAGFATLRLNDPTEGEGVLFGVAPRAQGRGIYRSFMIDGMHWCRGRGAKRMVVSTQVTNLAVQKAWTRLGFEPSRSYYTFHLWFDGSRGDGTRS